DDVGAAVEQARTDVHQQFDQQRLLVGEVPVDGGAADAHRGTEVLEAQPGVSAFGDQPGGGLQQLAAPVGLGLTAASGCRSFRGGVCHGEFSSPDGGLDNSVKHSYLKFGY